MGKAETIIRQRRAESFKVSKVEGRATTQHVIDRITTEETKEGNRIANHCVTKAHDLSKDHAIEFANFFVHRIAHYAEYIQVV